MQPPRLTSDPKPASMPPLGDWERLRDLLRLHGGPSFVLRSNAVRNLFWGLVCFSILMFFIAWAGIGSLFVPVTSGEAVRFIDMPAPLLALNVALCLLPVAALVLILAGIAGMVVSVPGIGPRLVWRLRGTDVSESDVGLLLVFSAIALYLGFFLMASARIPAPLHAIAGLSLSIVLTAIPIGLGWFLMFLSGWALAPLARSRERIAILIAVVSSGLLAALLVGAGIGATSALGSAALESGAIIPARVPAASAASGAGGFAALLVLTVLARRIGRRYDQARAAGTARPS